jgi:hypothetical protein
VPPNLTVSAVSVKNYGLKGVFFLAFEAHFGYHSGIVIERKLDVTVL